MDNALSLRPLAVLLRIASGQVRRMLGHAPGLRRFVGRPMLTRLKLHAGPGPALGSVQFGDLRRTTPIEPDFGFTRGQPIDRYYIESFLDRRRQDITGVVMEIGDDGYTRQFGHGVTARHVFHVNPDHPGATWGGTLEHAPQIPSDSYDCIILTQTLQMIEDPPAALATLARILKPGGVLLATVPCISKIDLKDWAENWYWGFTPAIVERLAGKAFGTSQVTPRGNVLAASAFLYGLCSAELTRRELDEQDPSYPIIVELRAVKTTS